MELNWGSAFGGCDPDSNDDEATKVVAGIRIHPSLRQSQQFPRPDLLGSSKVQDCSLNGHFSSMDDFPKKRPDVNEVALLD